MIPTRSATLRLARRCQLRPQRRFESSHKPADSHGASHDAHHAAPKNESFGPGFYILIAAMPVGYWLFNKAENPNPQPSFLSKWIPDWSADWERRNALHTLAVEQAGTDRALFHNAPHRQNVELRFDEAFNTGSPYNKSSSDSVNLDKVIEHYKQKNKETAERIEKKTPEQRFAARAP